MKNQQDWLKITPAIIATLLSQGLEIGSDNKIQEELSEKLATVNFDTTPETKDGGYCYVSGG